MAYKDLNIDDNLKYLKLDPDRKINEFVDAKNAKIRGTHVGRDCLPKCSKMFDLGEAYPNSILTEEILKKVAKKEEAEKEKEIFNSKLQEVLSTDNTQIIQNFIEKYPTYEKLNEIKEKLDSIKMANQAGRHEEVNKKVLSAYKTIMQKKGSKIYKKELDKFVKKWEASKNNKGSDVVMDYVQKAKKLL